MKSHEALLAARAALEDIKAKAQRLVEENQIATTECEAAESELFELMGLAKLGEGEAAAVKAARVRRDKASDSLRALQAAAQLIDKRLAAAEQAENEAKEYFWIDARDRIQDEYEALRDRLFQQTEALAVTLRRLTQVDAVALGIQIGLRADGSIVRAAGNVFETIKHEQGIEFVPSFHRLPKRLTEEQVVAIIDKTEVAS